MQKEKRITLSKEQLSIGSQYFVCWDKGKVPQKCVLKGFDELFGFPRVQIELIKPKQDRTLNMDEIGRTTSEARNNYVY